MNIQDLGAIGELIGSLAVVVTLIYLAKQIRQNTKVSESLVRQHVAESRQTAFFTAVESPAFSELIYRGFSGGDISIEEAPQFWRFLNGVFLNWEQAYYQYSAGLYSDWETVLEPKIEEIFNTSVFVQDWWRKNRASFSHDFAVQSDRLSFSKGKQN